jgi:hypothetical protein
VLPQSPVVQATSIRRKSQSPTKNTGLFPSRKGAVFDWSNKLHVLKCLVNLGSSIVRKHHAPILRTRNDRHMAWPTIITSNFVSLLDVTVCLKGSRGYHHNLFILKRWQITPESPHGSEKRRCSDIRLLQQQVSNATTFRHSLVSQSIVKTYKASLIWRLLVLRASGK